MKRQAFPNFFSILFIAALFASLLCGCGGQSRGVTDEPELSDLSDSATAGYLVANEDEPDTVDFQCTSIHYTVALNVFDRLVEMRSDESGTVGIQPSLAESWEISEDGLRYTFHLRPDVTFSNGSPLTASDVLYSFTRLLTHPDSCNSDVVQAIAGAAALENGEADTLAGFEILDDYDFVITLEEPFSAFLACISTPGASILDQETTEEAGNLFGTVPAWTIGTGPFILDRWTPGEGMLLSANPDCWSGPPACAGLDLRFLTEPKEEQLLFENGELDFLDLDELGDDAEYYFNGNVYQSQLRQVQQIGITYIALNESVTPLDDVRVRRAMQLALDRQALLDAVYSGRGSLENGIFSQGLMGSNPDLPEIPYDPAEAKELLAEAGYADGFDLVVSVKSSSTQWESVLMSSAVPMWQAVGIRAEIRALDESEFMRARKAGELACYAATWTADFNDPDNYIYTFFGTKENTTFRSLCYADEAVMERVRLARAISDEDARMAEYQALEEKIVQEDAAWIPLFSRYRYYVVGDRIGGFEAAWNGSIKTNYRLMSVSEQRKE